MHARRKRNRDYRAPWRRLYVFGVSSLSRGLQPSLSRGFQATDQPLNRAPGRPRLARPERSRRNGSRTVSADASVAVTRITHLCQLRHAGPKTYSPRPEHPSQPAFFLPALAVSLAFSALLTALALQAPAHHWLAWISFLPLFVAVRWLRPAKAALAGGLWGASLYLFTAVLPTTAAIAPAIDPAIAPSAWLLVLLIVIPAVYVGLAARPARAIGFKLLTLALGWTLIEVVVGLHSPSSPHEGLLTGSQGESPQLHWFARLLGYVFVALLVACANASLVGIASGARLSFPACMSLAGSPNAGVWLPSQVVRAIQSWTLCQAYPRAPPIPVAGLGNPWWAMPTLYYHITVMRPLGGRVLPSGFDRKNSRE